MRKLQDDSEAAFVKRLETIPDGTWSEEGWLETKLPGDRGVCTATSVTVTKTGDRLIFSNAGSARAGRGDQRLLRRPGRAPSSAMLNAMMLFDQMFAIEGALRHCDFEIEPGTISFATFPAAVSGGARA